MEADLPTPRVLSRRALLKAGAIAGTAAGGAAVGGLGLSVAVLADQPAGIQPNRGSELGGGGGPRVSVPASAVSNVVSLGDFTAINGTLTYVMPKNGMYSNGTSSPYVLTELDVPPGASILAVLGYGTSSAGQTWSIYRHDLVGNAITLVPPPQTTAAGYQVATFDFTGSPIVVAPSFRYLVQALPSNDVNNVLNGVTYYYMPAHPSFTAIPPARVYDSRLSGTPLISGQTRVVSVATTTGGATVVPASASAVLYNLTVTDTFGSGFLALFPFGVTWPGNSSINWVGSTQDANGGVVKLGGDRQVNVFCGGGSTNLVIDVTGYYL